MNHKLEEDSEIKGFHELNISLMTIQTTFALIAVFVYAFENDDNFIYESLGYVENGILGINKKPSNIWDGYVPRKIPMVADGEDFVDSSWDERDYSDDDYSESDSDEMTNKKSGLNDSSKNTNEENELNNEVQDITDGGINDDLDSSKLCKKRVTPPADLTLGLDSFSPQKDEIQSEEKTENSSKESQETIDYYVKKLQETLRLNFEDFMNKGGMQDMGKKIHEKFSESSNIICNLKFKMHRGTHYFDHVDGACVSTAAQDGSYVYYPTTRFMVDILLESSAESGDEAVESPEFSSEGCRKKRILSSEKYDSKRQKVTCNSNDEIEGCLNVDRSKKADKNSPLKVESNKKFGKSNSSPGEKSSNTDKSSIKQSTGKEKMTKMKSDDEFMNIMRIQEQKCDVITGDNVKKSVDNFEDQLEETEKIESSESPKKGESPKITESKIENGNSISAEIRIRCPDGTERELNIQTGTSKSKNLNENKNQRNINEIDLTQSVNGILDDKKEKIQENGKCVEDHETGRRVEDQEQETGKGAKNHDQEAGKDVEGQDQETGKRTLEQENKILNDSENIDESSKNALFVPIQSITAEMGNDIQTYEFPKNTAFLDDVEFSQTIVDKSVQESKENVSSKWVDKKANSGKKGRKKK